MASEQGRPSRLGASSDPLPVLTVDIDGVVARPILGMNVGIHRDFLDPHSDPRPAVIWPDWLAKPWDRLRYNIRRPLPEAREALERLAQVRRLVAVTGRRTHPGGWLRHYRLETYFDEVRINEGHLRSPHYKLGVLRDLGASEHVEDDPRTAQLVAEAGGIRVYLRDWPRNRGLSFHPGVVRVADLRDLAGRLAAGAPEGRLP